MANLSASTLAGRHVRQAIVRQLRIVTSRIAEYDGYLATDALSEENLDSAGAYEEAIRIMADRLMHLAARMTALGYDPPGLEAAREILKRRGLPSTLEEWREQAAGQEEEPGGED